MYKLLMKVNNGQLVKVKFILISLNKKINILFNKKKNINQPMRKEV
jgi:hypothetical protein